MSWYYVDPAGATKGPLSIAQLKPLYGSQLKDNTYIWNGTTVAQWTALNKVPDILKQLKPKPAAPKSGRAAPPGSQPGTRRRRRRRRRRRKNPMGGGGGLYMIYHIYSALHYMSLLHILRIFAFCKYYKL